MSAAPRPLWLPSFTESAFDFIVIASSYGGVEALKQLVMALPSDFPVPIALAHHVGCRVSSLVPILAWKSRLTIRWAEEGLRPRPRTLYVAPPDLHLELSARRTFTLSSGPKVNFTRPAADPLFESAAQVYGHRCMGIVLTGMGRDGAQGARAIRAAGGIVLAQDRESSEAFGMPGAVISEGQANFVLPLSKIAPAMVSLTMVPCATELFGIPRPALASQRE